MIGASARLSCTVLSCDGLVTLLRAGVYRVKHYGHFGPSAYSIRPVSQNANSFASPFEPAQYILNLLRAMFRTERTA